MYNYRGEKGASWVGWLGCMICEEGWDAWACSLGRVRDVGVY